MGWNDHTHSQLNAHWNEQSEPAAASCPKDLREVVSGVVEVTRWDKDFADCLCPACGRTDARLFYDDRFPVIYCFGSGCEDSNSSTNAELVRRAKQVCGERGFKVELTQRDKAQIAFRRRLKVLEAQAKNRLLPRLLKQPAVTMVQWERESPYPVAGVAVEKHWRLLLMGLHEQEQTILSRYIPGKGITSGYSPPRVWIGYLWESGGPEFSISFKTVTDWLAKPCPYGPQVSVCTFKPWRTSGSHTQALDNFGKRSKEWVERKDYFVAESDVLSREQFGCIIRWIQKFATLRAIVDTGNKSLHGWFEELEPPPRQTLKEPRFSGDSVMDEPAEWAEYKRTCDAWKQKHKAEIAHDLWRWKEFYRRRTEFYAILRGLACDPGMFRLASTARLPGVERLDDEGRPTGRWQRLLYLNPKYPVKL